MTTNRLFAKLRSAVSQFARAKDGSTMVTFALAFIPLVGLTGAAVDYSQANQIKTAMQAAGDTTALAMAQVAAAQTSSALQTSGTNFFKALFTRTNVANLAITTTYSTTNGSKVLVNATATFNTNFMGVMGIHHLPIATSSTASFGNSRLRVALVLDNTGSMAQSGKITALKTATNNLLNQLRAAAINNGDVYVSIVPFVKDINADSSNYSASWIYWDDAAQSDTNSWDANNGTCSQSGSDTRSACTAQGSCSISNRSSQNSCTSAGSCSISGDTTRSTCQADFACSDPSHSHQNSCVSHGGTWSAGVWTTGVWTQATWTPANHNTWNGCVTDRGDSGAPNSANYDTNVVAPSTSIAASQFPAEQYGSCPQAVMGLNYNWASMTTLVNNMSPNGNTNQAIGLAWGWLSLAGGGPFSVPAMDPNYTYQQVIILLTDGLNTQDRWYTNQSSIDARQAMTCANIKAAGIILYTIQVNTGGDATSTLLQQCASDSSKFFLLTSSSAIVTTFNQIGTNLSKLRIAK